MTQYRSPRNRQAQSITAQLAGAGRVSSIECLKNFLQFRLGYAAALVCDSNQILVQGLMQRYFDH